MTPRFSTLTQLMMEVTERWEGRAESSMATDDVLGAHEALVITAIYHTAATIHGRLDRIEARLGLLPMHSNGDSHEA